MEETIIENLRQIEANYPQNKETAAYWIETIIEKQAFLSNRKHPVVFISDVGVGKTSIIATLANLFVGGKACKKKTSSRIPYYLLVQAVPPYVKLRFIHLMMKKRTV
jgi:flagellar biosynthesis GTPase FlhF